MHEAMHAALRELRAAVEQMAARPPTQPLRTIFSELEGAHTPLYVRARRLAIDEETLFPTGDADAALGDAAALVAELQQAAAQIAPDAPDAVDRLFYLLQEYAWALPSDDDPAVSLFDRARTRAALAAARAGHATDAVLLLGGDISGVQDFIYTTTAEGATKALRGRSLYLQLVTEAVARWLLRQAGMPITNLLYSGGGHFYLLLPARDEAQIDAWRTRLGRWLLRRHAGELYVALGGCRISADESDDPERFRRSWMALHQDLSADKRRRFASLEPDLLAQELFTPQGPGGEQQTCVVCRYQGQPGEFRPFEPDRERGLPEAEVRRICRLCHSFEDLATEVRNSRFLLLEEGAEREVPQRERTKASEVLADLGIRFDVADDERHLERALQDRQGGVTVLSLATPVAPALRRRFPQAIWGLRPLVNVTPILRAAEVEQLRAQLDPDERERLEANQIKTFAILTEQSRGVKRLGVLRMDVDDLGDLITFRLPRLSLPRIGALSMALERFFSGWVGELCRQANADERGERVYAVYSGGDDLFIVGSWDALPRLARHIRRDLERYVGGDQVRASAGISLHPAKFPLYQAARAAGNELDRAKDLPGKNAFCFLEQVIGWEQMDEVFSLHERLMTLLGGNGAEGALKRAALQVMQELYSQYRRPSTWRRQPRQPSGQAGPWIWRGAYQLTRMEEQIKNDQHGDHARALLSEIRRRLAEGLSTATTTANLPARRRPYIELLGLAARWAQLEARKE